MSIATSSALPSFFRRFCSARLLQLRQVRRDVRNVGGHGEQAGHIDRADRNDVTGLPEFRIAVRSSDFCAGTRFFRTSAM